MRARVLARLFVVPLGMALVALPVDANAVPAPAAAAGESRVHRASVPDVALSARSGRSAAEVRRYWTQARMREASVVGAPTLHAPPGEVLASARASGLLTGGAPRYDGVVVPRTVGKLFVRSPYGDRMCTAAVMRAKRKNQVITAGHCVNGGQYGGWYSDWLFVPQYDNGRAPRGTWVGKRAYAPGRWTHRSDFRFDYAIVKLRKRHGRKIQRVVGGNGVRLGRNPWKRDVRVWGWPAQSPYSGEHAVMCQGRTSRYGGGADAKIKCPMTGGASGGPWLLENKRKRHRGLIFAVTSRRTASGTAYLLATPLPKAFRKLKRRAN